MKGSERAVAGALKGSAAPAAPPLAAAATAVVPRGDGTAAIATAAAAAAGLLLRPPVLRPATASFSSVAAAGEAVSAFFFLAEADGGGSLGGSVRMMLPGGGTAGPSRMSHSSLSCGRTSVERRQHLKERRALWVSRAAPSLLTASRVLRSALTAAPHAKASEVIRAMCRWIVYNCYMGWVHAVLAAPQAKA